METFKDKPTYFQKRNYLEGTFDVGNSFRLVSVDNTVPFAEVKTELEKLIGHICTFASLAELLQAELHSNLSLPRHILVAALGTTIGIEGRDEDGKGPKGFVYQFISWPPCLELSVENARGIKDVFRGTTTFVLVRENQTGAIEACRARLYNLNGATDRVSVEKEGNAACP